MGIGMVIATSPDNADAILSKKQDRVIYKIGQVVNGEGVSFC
jgi:phosphoribosylaminoimidazole (AIR) synthetase